MLASYALPAVIVKLVIVTLWALAIDVLSSVISPPPPVAVTVPCAWQVVPPESYRRQCPAVPVALALASCHVPESAFEPEFAAAIQSDGSVASASSVPDAAAAQFTGAEPE